MVTTKWLLENVMASKLPFSYVWGEILELVEAVLCFDVEEASCELQDVIANGAVWFTGKTGVNVRLHKGFGLSAAQRWVKRHETWELIFRAHGVEFHKSYLTGGGNFRKKSKIRKALAHVGVELNLKAIESLQIKFED